MYFGLILYLCFKFDINRSGSFLYGRKYRHVVKNNTFLRSRVFEADISILKLILN